MSKNLKMLLLSASCVCVQCDSGGQVGALFTGALREAKGSPRATASLVVGLDLNPGLQQDSHLGTTLVLIISLR